MVTARGEQYQCQMCGPAESHFKAAAKGYLELSPEDKQQNIPVYFGVIDIANAQGYFQEHQIQSGIYTTTL